MSEWIRVDDERKPPLARDEESCSVEVLLYVPTWEDRSKSGVVVGHYLHKSKVFRPTASMGYEKEVTHWTFKPEPPEDHP